MQIKVNELVRLYQSKLAEIESSSLEIKAKLKKSFEKTQDNLNNLGMQLKQFENPSDKIVKIITKKVRKAESSLQKLYREIERIQSFV